MAAAAGVFPRAPKRPTARLLPASCLFAASVALFGPSRAYADWLAAPATNAFGTATNWSGGTINGTFSSTSAFTTLSVSNGQQIATGGNLVFNGASTPTYTLGTAANAGYFTLFSGGSVTLNSGVTASQIVNAGLTQSGGTSANKANTLTASAAGVSLTVNGDYNNVSNAGSFSTGLSNYLNFTGTGGTGFYAGVISDGKSATGTAVAGNLIVKKSGTATWTLSGTNTYTGGTELATNSGTLSLGNKAALGTGAIRVIGGTGGTGNGFAAGTALTGTDAVANTINYVGTTGTATSATYGGATGGPTVGSNQVTITTAGTGTPAVGDLITGNLLGYFPNYTRVTAVSGSGVGAVITLSNVATLTTTTATTASAAAFNSGGGGTFTVSGSNAIEFSGTQNLTTTNSNLATATQIFNITNAADTLFTGLLQQQGGTANIDKQGTGKLFVANAANSYTGSTKVSTGTLNVSSLANGGSNSAIGASTNVAANLQLGGGTLQYTGVTAQTTDRLFTNSPSVAALGNTNSIDASGSAAGATLSFTNTGTNASGTVGRVGSGTSGGTTITGLVSTADLKVGASVTASTLPGGATIVSISATSVVLSNPVNSTASVTFAFGGVDRTLALMGTNAGANTIAGALIDANTGTGPVGALGVSKTGVGTWVLTGASTYTGGTTISAGTLQIGNGGSTGSIAGTAIVNNSALVTNRTGTLTLGQAISGSGSLLQTANSGTAVGILAVTNASSSFAGTTTIQNGTIDVGANSILGGVNGPLGNAASAIVLGNASTLASAVGSGSPPNAVLQVTGPASSADFTISRDIDSSTTANVDGRNDIRFNGAAGATGKLTVSGNWALGNTTTRAYGLAAAQTGQTLDYTGTITGGNAAAPLRINDYGSGSGVVRLGNVNNSYANQTNVTNGTLLIAGDAAAAGGVLGTNAILQIAEGGNTTSVPTGAYTDGAYTVGKTVTLSDNSTTTGATSGYYLGGNQPAVSAFTGNVNTNSSANGRTLYLSQVSGGTVTFSGVIGANANATGATSVAKVGGGKVALTNANAYDGTTTVSAGTLLANNDATIAGSATGGGAVTVNQTGTLAGTGRVGGSVTVGDGTAGSGTISAGGGAANGDAVGTLITGAQAWKPGGAYAIKFASAAFDNLNMDLLDLSGLSGGTFNLAVVNNAAGSFVGNTSYRIATTAGIKNAASNTAAAGELLTSLFTLSLDGIADTAGDFTVTAAKPDGSGSASDLYLNYQMQATPEPTTVALVALGTLPLAGRRRRRTA